MADFLDADLCGGDDETDGLRRVNVGEWRKMQERTFTAWCNERLKHRNECVVNSLAEDFSDGVLLINLLEILSGKDLGHYTKQPKEKFKKLANCQLALEFMKAEGIKLVGIGNEDVVDGVQHHKLILGLVWTLILRYQIEDHVERPTDDASGDAIADDPTIIYDPTLSLLAWVQSKVPEKNITNFTKDWRSGINIAALVDAIQPGLCPEHKTMDESTALENAQLAMERAFSRIGVPKVLTAEDLVSQNNNQCCVMTYISCLKDARLRTDFKAFIDDRASVSVARNYHNAGTDEVMHAVLCAQDCDLDSLVSAIAHAYFNEQVNLRFDQASSVLIPVFNANRHSIPFCTDAIYLFDECDVTSSNVTCTDDVDLKAFQTDGRLKLTLVNHNRLASHQTHFIPDVVEILDCHDNETEDVYEPTLPLWVEPSVACTATLIAECYLDQMPHLLEQNPEIVKLLLGVILYKTENLKEGGPAGEREREAVERLGKLTDVNQTALYDELERRGRDRKSFVTSYDVLRRDFKEADEAPRDIRSGVALLHDEHVEEFLTRVDAGRSLARLVDEEKLGVLVVMSECRDDGAPKGVRSQLAVYGGDELAEKVAEYLQGREDLSMNALPGRDNRIQIFSVNDASQRDVVLAHVVAYLKGEKEMVPIEKEEESQPTVSLEVLPEVSPEELPELPSDVPLEEIPPEVSPEVPPPEVPHQSIDMSLIQPYCNVMWLSGHQNDIPVIICAACHLPDKGIPGYNKIMQHLYRFCFQFMKRLRCTKFIAIYLYGGTGGRNVDKFGWMRQWYFLLTRRFGGKIQNVYLLHGGFWIEKLLKITGLFMSRKLYEKLAFVSTIEELSQYVDTHQINFPQAVVEG